MGNEQGPRTKVWRLEAGMERDHLVQLEALLCFDKGTQ